MKLQRSNRLYLDKVLGGCINNSACLVSEIAAFKFCLRLDFFSLEVRFEISFKKQKDLIMHKTGVRGSFPGGARWLLILFNK